MTNLSTLPKVEIPCKNGCGRTVITTMAVAAAQGKYCDECGPIVKAERTRGYDHKKRTGQYGKRYWGRVSRLTSEDVEEVRRIFYSAPNGAVLAAERFGFNRHYIYHIVKYGHLMNLKRS